MYTPTILITMPKRPNDPTQFTYTWGKKAQKMALDLKYKVITLEKEQANYQNVTHVLQNNNVRLYLHVGHGCDGNLQGQHNCMVKVNAIDQLAFYKQPTEKLLCMANHGSYDERLMALSILNDRDPCDLYCNYPENADLLNGMIVYAVACHSVKRLGMMAVTKYGTDAFAGYDDTFLFPADSMGTQDMYGDINLVMFKEILMGHTVRESEAAMSAKEDEFISRYKPYKYVALPMLYDKVHRKLIGNLDKTIFSNQQLMLIS